MEYEPVQKGLKPPESGKNQGEKIPGNKAEGRNNKRVGQGKEKQQRSGIAPPEQKAGIRGFPAASFAQAQKISVSHGSASFPKK
jgi:hypothetical protein